ncbi:MAG: hypothetical protein EZS28_045016, partial [Streblomastix strix]
MSIPIVVPHTFTQDPVTIKNDLISLQVHLGLQNPQSLGSGQFGRV